MKLSKAQLTRIHETAVANYRTSMPDSRDGSQIHLAECWLSALISTLKNDGVIITSRDVETGAEVTLEVL